MVIMTRLDAMQAFVAVAELRGFARAARRLRLSPSAVTRLVAGLEDELGIRLLQRTTRSVSLTDAGARYLDRARGILAAVADAETAARSESTAPRGRLVVAAPLVFGRREVAPLLSAFLARHPQVAGELVLGDRNVNLIDEGVDVAVRIGPLADSSLHARPAGRTRWIRVASPAYLRRRKPPRRPADLADHALIHLTMLPQPAVPAVFTSNSADAVIGHALAGGGIATVLSYQVADEVRRGALRVLLPDHAPAPVPIHLVYPTGRMLAASVKAFIDLTLATARWDFARLR